MFGFFGPRKADVINHWIALAEGFNMAPGEFYDAVEKELKVREVPGLEISRVDFAEGGALSDKRVYLRMLRERLVFDVCAAPFGKGFFFSSRMAEIPAPIRLWQIIVLFVLFWIAFNIVTYFAWRFLGLITGSVLLVMLFVLAIYVLRNAIALGLRDLDAMLVKSPLTGPIYLRFFRKETYYRHDTRLMYLEVVPSVVKKLAEDCTAAKGVKLVKQYELAPVLGELYKPAPHVTSQAAAT